MSDPGVLHTWDDVDAWRVRSRGIGDVRLEGKASRNGAPWVEIATDPVEGMLLREVVRLAERVRELERDLAECFRLSGADPDGNEDWRLAGSAVQEVRRLREDYDEACTEAGELEAYRKLSRIYFEIAAAEVGEEKVREKRDATIADRKSRADW